MKTFIDSWCLRRPPAAPRLRLFCFSYAGGNAAAYLPWQAALGPDIELCAIQLPGRGVRLLEPPVADMQALVVAASRVVDQLGDLPCAFFGHSLGALVAYKLAHHRAAQDLPMPRHLIVSGTAAPRRRKAKALHLLDDGPLIDELRKYNGTPGELLAHQELMALVLPVLRADFKLVADFAPEERRLSCPLTVFAGRQDEHDDATEYDDWLNESSAGGRVQWFDGDHFFINSCTPQVLDAIRAALLSSLQHGQRELQASR